MILVQQVSMSRLAMTAEISELLEDQFDADYFGGSLKVCLAAHEAQNGYCVARAQKCIAV
jgi:hypothetical protein